MVTAPHWRTLRWNGVVSLKVYIMACTPCTHPSPEILLHTPRNIGAPTKKILRRSYHTHCANINIVFEYIYIKRNRPRVDPHGEPREYIANDFPRKRKSIFPSSNTGAALFTRRSHQREALRKPTPAQPPSPRVASVSKTTFLFVAGENDVRATTSCTRVGSVLRCREWARGRMRVAHITYHVAHIHTHTQSMASPCGTGSPL